MSAPNEAERAALKQRQEKFREDLQRLSESQPTRRRQTITNPTDMYGRHNRIMGNKAGMHIQTGISSACMSSMVLRARSLSV